jgi:hypothetical protein
MLWSISKVYHRRREFSTGTFSVHQSQRPQPPASESLPRRQSEPMGRRLLPLPVPFVSLSSVHRPLCFCLAVAREGAAHVVAFLELPLRIAADLPLVTPYVNRFPFGGCMFGHYCTSCGSESAHGTRMPRTVSARLTSS